MFKKALHFTVFLALLSGLAGGALAYVNSITAPIINENAIAAEKVNLVKLFPGTSEFAPLEITNDETGFIQSAYTAKDAGIAYKVQVMGYANPIVFMVGISNDGKIVGLEILDLRDTAGIGTRVEDPEFKDNVVGKTTTDPLAALSGATVTSGAVIRGINAAKAHFNDSKGIDDGGGSDDPVTPPLAFGDPVGIFSNATASAPAEILEETTDGDVTTYLVASKGYAVLEGGYEGAKPNVFKIVINTAEKKVVSMELVEFNDTTGLGDKIDHEDFWAQFEGLATDDDSIEIDVVSGATVTAISAARALRGAIGE